MLAFECLFLVEVTPHIIKIKCTGMLANKCSDSEAQEIAP
jgi:hypothetical protein